MIVSRIYYVILNPINQLHQNSTQNAEPLRPLLSALMRVYAVVFQKSTPPFLGEIPTAVDLEYEGGLEPCTPTVIYSRVYYIS